MKNLILLHGALGSSKQFDEIENLLEPYFNIYSFDFCSHGKNSLSDEKLTIDLFTEELNQFIVANEINGCDIFGYSMGGYVAINHALKFPEISGSIFTHATKFNWTPESAVNEAKMLNPELIMEKVPKFAEDLKELHGNKWKTLTNNISGMINELGIKQPFSIDDLSNLPNRITISVGDKDAMVSVGECLSAVRAVKNSRFIVMPDTKHPIKLINEERLIRELIEFFGE